MNKGIIVGKKAKKFTLNCIEHKRRVILSQGNKLRRREIPYIFSFSLV